MLSSYGATPKNTDLIILAYFLSRKFADGLAGKGKNNIMSIHVLSSGTFTETSKPLF